MAAAPQGPPPVGGLAGVFQKAGLGTNLVEATFAAGATNGGRDAAPGYDERGREVLGARMFPAGVKPRADQLVIALVGSAHIPAIADLARTNGFSPFATGFGTAGNTDAPFSFGPPDFDYALAMRRAPLNTPSPAPGAPPLLLIGEQHMASTTFMMPSAAELVQQGIKSVRADFENENRGPLDRASIELGSPNKAAIGLRLQEYRNAGIQVEMNGLDDKIETNGSSAASLLLRVLLDEQRTGLTVEALGGHTLEALAKWRDDYKARGPQFAAQAARYDRAIAELTPR